MVSSEYNKNTYEYENITHTDAKVTKLKYKVNLHKNKGYKVAEAMKTKLTNSGLKLLDKSDDDEYYFGIGDETIAYISFSKTRIYFEYGIKDNSSDESK